MGKSQKHQVFHAIVLLLIGKKSQQVTDHILEIACNTFKSSNKKVSFEHTEK